jgi:hypothetical protein
LLSGSEGGPAKKLSAAMVSSLKHPAPDLVWLLIGPSAHNDTTPSAAVPPRMISNIAGRGSWNSRRKFFGAALLPDEQKDHRGDLVAWPLFTEHRRGLID